MLDYWKNVITKNYANFNGRARRSEYWYYTLMNVIILIGLQILIAVCAFNQLGAASMILGIVYLLYALGTLVPSLAVGVRRLHDVGKSGWYLLVSLIPIVGSIWLLVLLCTDSEAGENGWGPNPKNQVSMNDDALDSHLAR
jgi:uncharacterized membrane protein YhaH (DUF805 family)